jgi:transposase
VQTICREFAARRGFLRRCPGWRSAKKSLGWVPFILRAVQVDGANVTYLKRRYQLWLSGDIGGEIKAGCFVQDARGRWYVALQCEVADDAPTGAGEIGIDLGLQALATRSDGTIVPALQHYRIYEAALAKARRANNTRRVRAIHAKVANVVGNVNAIKLTKTRMAKSVLDAGWSTFRNQLRYKASRHGARYVEADERWTSQLSSDCGAVGGPKGIAQLGMRHWVCFDCGLCHDRDVNAARNILNAGLERQAPAEEISGL